MVTLKLKYKKYIYITLLSLWKREICLILSRVHPFTTEIRLQLTLSVFFISETTKKRNIFIHETQQQARQRLATFPLITLYDEMMATAASLYLLPTWKWILRRSYMYGSVMSSHLPIVCWKRIEVGWVFRRFFSSSHLSADCVCICVCWITHIYICGLYSYVSMDGRVLEAGKKS